MKITKRHNVRLYPNIEQQTYLLQNLGNYRWVYNQSLAYRQSFYAAHGKNPSTKQVHTHLAELKEEHEWLKLCDAASLQQALRDLDDAYRRFFKH
jgi:putative transposase